MKKYVKAATNISETTFDGIYDTIYDVAGEYYDVSVYEDLRAVLIPHDMDYPEIEVDIVVDGDKITFDATLKFYPISTSDGSLSGYCENIVDKWMNAAKAADVLKRKKLSVRKLDDMYSE